jgi:hypothetical protein
MEHYSIEQMKADLMELQPVERLKIMTGLLDFFMPKLNRTDHSLSKDNETITILLPGDEPEAKIIEEPDEDRFLESEDIQPDLFTDVEGSE